MTDNNYPCGSDEPGDSIATKVAKATETTARLRTRWGRGEKRTTREQHALLFASRLHAAGGTFSYTQTHRDFGYGNIWQAFAGELHDPAANVVQKVHNVEEYEALYRSGCTQLNAKLLEQWNDVQVFLVPSTVDGALIHHLTIDPDFVVNEAGDTAKTIWEKRELKRANGQIRAVAKKLARATSPAEALAQIANLVRADELVGMVALPPGRLEDQALLE
jgi:hypothetical protein